MNACETTPHSPGKRLAPNHHSTENVEEARKPTLTRGTLERKTETVRNMDRQCSFSGC